VTSYRIVSLIFFGELSWSMVLERKLNVSDFMCKIENVSKRVNCLSAVLSIYIRSATMIQSRAAKLDRERGREFEK
jgi:hypothetical protein